MLDHLRQRLVETLASTQAATLATYGPADIQSGVFLCEAADAYLYLLVPRVSDHLLNIEGNPRVLVTTGGWQLRGLACGLSSAECPIYLGLLSRAERPLCQVVRVFPQRLQIMPRDGQHYETIDVDDPESPAYAQTSGFAKERK